MILIIGRQGFEDVKAAGASVERNRREASAIAVCHIRNLFWPRKTPWLKDLLMLFMRSYQSKKQQNRTPCRVGCVQTDQVRL